MPAPTTPAGPLIVAEISGNHNGSLPRALDIVRAVADTGASAVKIQTYTPDTITLDVDAPAFRISEGHDLWSSRTLYDLYREAHTPWEWHEPIFELARDLGLVAFSTPFDETSVEFLESLDVPLYKIASLEIVDLPLIAQVARTGKPMIVSVGTASIGEVDAAVTAARSGGCTDLTLLACTSSYPAEPDDANLLRMPAMQRMWGAKVGLSDHTLGIGVSVAATALGATVIEKHVTLSRGDGGVDAAFSLEPSELAQLVAECDAAARALGSADAWATSAESESLRLRPSLYIAADVRAGERFTPENVRSVRPSGGLPPAEIDRVLGRTAARDAATGTPVNWDLVAPADQSSASE
ncbi:pseudaminic acid synthase [Agromyces marinus]|uniref:Pseudaminic acid synthase n=1 Tax=Agromyces marinus TaxID=1389020 RepID=A0ABM8GZ48_9MICO|nr:pseudaminic acid synthase [Agromyces marinus]UIP58036.1 Pseudaminic acid synthase [Agromyces marinus]BDZ53747.1 pseudaminic acid synthase [Agromyces marinus]